MSSGQNITVEPDKYNQVIADNAKAGFLDQGFINTMRFSELNGDEEYDNTFLYTIWHGYLETGLEQLREYKEWILRETHLDLKAGKWTSDDKNEVWPKIPIEQQNRILRLLNEMGKYDFSKPVDDKKNIYTIRNYLQDYNQNFMDGIMFYDCHIAILNGRMARNRGHKKELLELARTVLQREYDIRTNQPQITDDKGVIGKITGFRK